MSRSCHQWQPAATAPHFAVLSKSGVPLIATGDFNDVAWSDTSQSFKHVGRYLDPRIGRGFFASFDADRPWLRFPIDQFYVTPDVAVVSIERRGYIGSDHFPMAATIRLDARLAADLNTSPPPSAALDRCLARRVLEAGCRGTRVRAKLRSEAFRALRPGSGRWCRRTFPSDSKQALELRNHGG